MPGYSYLPQQQPKPDGHDALIESISTYARQQAEGGEGRRLGWQALDGTRPPPPPGPKPPRPPEEETQQGGGPQAVWERAQDVLARVRREDYSDEEAPEEGEEGASLGGTTPTRTEVEQETQLLDPKAPRRRKLLIWPVFAFLLIACAVGAAVLFGLKKSG
eukprot:Hpha_TRINITY_DN1416_c0_g1::TRINITY_DN1416_c0_g1_i1::g.9693::m.9693